MQEEYNSHTDKILCVVTGCGGGDWPPLLALAAGLHRSGHNLVVVCDNITVKSVKAAGLKPLCLPQSLDLANVFEPAILRLLAGLEKPGKGGENPLMIWGLSCNDYILRSLGGWEPAMVITSLFGLGLGEKLAKEYSVPRCFLNPSFNFGHSGEEFRGADFSEAGGQMYRHWLLPLAKSADLVLLGTDKKFDISLLEIPSNHFYVGPMFWEERGESLSQLYEAGPPWVLITLSTSPQVGEMAIVETALKPLEFMDVRVLVTLAPGHNKDELGRLPANAHIAGYIPHSHVLPQCLLMISHAGHGIVMKAMTHGVPMVLVPWGRDQPGVAFRAERMGIARVVAKNGCSVETLSEAIDLVLNDPGYEQRSHKISSHYSSINGVAKAIGHIERFLTRN